MTSVAASPKTRAEDFLATDRLLSDEERDIRDTVRAFVADKVTPHVGDWFEQGTIPRELATELGKLNVAARARRRTVDADRRRGDLSASDLGKSNHAQEGDRAK